MYHRVLRPLLFSLSCEQSHHLAILLLRIVGFVPGGRWLLGKCCAVEHPALEREVFGVRFRNPIGMAAGFDRNGEVYGELSAMGFGFVEIGAITPRAQSGNPTPRIFSIQRDKALINRVGCPNKGLETAIRHLRNGHQGVVVGCNIASNASTRAEEAAGDYLRLFRNLYQYADYFTVNLCGDDAQEPGLVRSEAYIRGVLEPLFDFRRGQNQYRPILIKISPDMSDEEIDRISDILVSTPLDGVVATSGSTLREGLTASPSSIKRIGAGRLSGKPLTKRAVEVVRRIHERSGGNYPIIGTGGVMTPEDVEAMLAAGADLVQLHTGFLYEGPRLVKEICNKLIQNAEPISEEPQEKSATPAETTIATPAETTAETAPETPSEPASETTADAAQTE